MAKTKKIKVADRGRFLTVLIVANAIFALFSLSSSFETESDALILGIDLPLWYYIISFFANLMTLASSWGIWHFQKWGVYALAGSISVSTLMVVFLLPRQFMMQTVIFSFILAVLWYVAIEPKWKLFKD